jgi:hypothetical protein
MPRSELTTALGLALERSTEAYRYARRHEALDDGAGAATSASDPAAAAHPETPTGEAPADGSAPDDPHRR